MPNRPLSPLPDDIADELYLTPEEARAELRALLEEGIASGFDDEEFDPEAVMSEVRERLAARKRA